MSQTNQMKCCSTRVVEFDGCVLIEWWFKPWNCQENHCLKIWKYDCSHLKVATKSQAQKLKPMSLANRWWQITVQTYKNYSTMSTIESWYMLVFIWAKITRIQNVQKKTEGPKNAGLQKPQGTEANHKNRQPHLDEFKTDSSIFLAKQ